MSDGSSYADLVILALIAGFILLRLRSVLGDKVGNDNPSYFNKIIPSASQAPAAIVQLDEKSLRPKTREEDPYLMGIKDSALAESIEQMREKDPQFTATAFLQGAKMAYEMVFDAFAKGDRKTLSMLLADDIAAQFAKEIDAREAAENKTETTLVSVKAKDITAASVTGSIARITVVFESEQVIVTRSSKGEVVGGDLSELHEAQEDWVFERNMTSKNPNWKIIET